jgi:hypothetical protein
MEENKDDIMLTRMNSNTPISSVEYTTENGIKKIDLTDAVIKLNTVLEQYVDDKVIRDNIINSFYNKFVKI